MFSILSHILYVDCCMDFENILAYRSLFLFLHKPSNYEMDVHHSDSVGWGIDHVDPFTQTLNSFVIYMMTMPSCIPSAVAYQEFHNTSQPRACIWKFK